MGAWLRRCCVATVSGDSEYLVFLPRAIRDVVGFLTGRPGISRRTWCYRSNRRCSRASTNVMAGDSAVLTPCLSNNLYQLPSNPSQDVANLPHPKFIKQPLSTSLKPWPAVRHRRGRRWPRESLDRAIKASTGGRIVSRRWPCVETRRPLLARAWSRRPWPAVRYRIFRRWLLEARCIGRSRASIHPRPPFCLCAGLASLLLRCCGVGRLGRPRFSYKAHRRRHGLLGDARSRRPTPRAAIRPRSPPVYQTTFINFSQPWPAVRTAAGVDGRGNRRIGR